MGIQHLNAYFRKNATIKSIHKISLDDLNGKKVVIDASIYLYRFMTEGALLENFYSMLSVFQHNNITPIFVFDGAAPPEKSQLLEKRCEDKNLAEQEYNKLKDELASTSYDDNKYGELCCDMILLKKQFIRIRRSDVAMVKRLITAFGVSYIEAEGEADALCAKLVIKKQAFACLSEDMDLFIYGCPRVLRYLSLMNETAIIYYLDNILVDLAVTFKEFKEICIISGTDYSHKTETQKTKKTEKTEKIKKTEKTEKTEKIKKTETNRPINLFTTFEYFKQYKDDNNEKGINFYEWLEANTDYIANIYQLYSIFNLFGTDNVNLKKIKLDATVKKLNMDEIKEIMIPEGFIFVKKTT